MHPFSPNTAAPAIAFCVGAGGSWPYAADTLNHRAVASTGKKVLNRREPGATLLMARPDIAWNARGRIHLPAALIRPRTAAVGRLYY
jgi:hypothetical protein